MIAPSSLNDFHPVVRRWFEKTYANPSPPQVLGWPSIAAGRNTLILAPTGSGKTMAAFLWAINHCVEQHLGGEVDPGVRILYVSPLKALNNDIERNLVAPLEGIRREAEVEGLTIPHLRTAVRTGDTPQAKRASMLRRPPDILITTPESLYLMLTSRQARKIFRTVQYCIVDEIHSVCSNKRGVHLSLSLERLQQIALQEIVRIGLSATQRPLETIAAFLGGQTQIGGSLRARDVAVVNAGQRKSMDLQVVCAAADLSVLPQESLWPMVFGEILDHIRRHRTTLVFVNNRRLAERVAAKLNEMAAGDDNEGFAAGRTFNLYAVPHAASGRNDSATPSRLGEQGAPDTPLVQAYHGSMSRQAREGMERDLKEGRIRGLIATSSLELGIDIGSIDLVLQLQSPKGVARGLQRVGRSGHLVMAESKGRIYPTHREDLVESTVVGRAMAEHDVEPVSIPTNCLDVLAQQIVAMVSVEEWNADELYTFVRQSYCYRDLPHAQFDGVLQMLAGRYSTEELRALHPRISWDRVNAILRALPGSSRLAVTGGGTIADRGYFGVYLEDGKTKVGEVDEEFVFETRAGDTFILGTSVWRVTGIDANRVSVVPAPGQPARMPFWRGEGIGRSVELGRQIGKFRRELADRLDDAGCLPWIQSEYPVDSRSAWNIQEYFRRQRAATSAIPNDRLLVVEGFRDELGDPRLVVHCALGRRVNGLLGLVLAHYLHQRTAAEPQMLYNDNGVLLRCPDVDQLPLDLFRGITAAEARQVVIDEVLDSPLFGGQFRQNAARSLLMPKLLPGKRMPLWLQRLRAADLLQVARRSSDFPIVIETIREVLNDILDFRHFVDLIMEIERGTVQVRHVHTEVPSPFAASLLFDFIAVYMYEWDQPRADRLSQYVAINREILAEIVDLDTLASLIRPDALIEVENELQHSLPGYRTRSPEELMELLIRLGDLTEEEILARCEGDARQLLRILAADGRAREIDFPSGRRWIAGEEEELYKAISEEENARRIVGRYLQNHGPVSTSELAGRFGFARERVDHLTGLLEGSGGFVRGNFRPSDLPGAEEPQWCYRPNIERIHRKTISILRREVTPSSPAEFSEFLLHWQHVHPSTRENGPAGLEEVLDQLAGIPLPAEIWERDILRQRIQDFTPDLLSEQTRRGEFIWIGNGPGRLMTTRRGEAGIFLPPAGSLSDLSAPAREMLEYFDRHGASFLADLRGSSGRSLAALNAALAELLWGAWITNDVFAELGSVRRSIRLGPETPAERIVLTRPRAHPWRSLAVRSARRAIKEVPGWSGRWSPVRVPPVMGPVVSESERAAAQARQLLSRYGIVAREFHRRENILPWSAIAAELQRMEMRGEIRRGYFVEGFSGMQFALPEAVEELRRVKSSQTESSDIVLVNSCDPAFLFGAGVELPQREGTGGQITRLPGNTMAFAGGEPVIWIENEGTRIRTLGRPDTETVIAALECLIALTKLPAPLKPIQGIRIEYWDGERPAGSSWAEVLRGLGFRGDANQTMRFDN